MQRINLKFLNDYPLARSPIAGEPEISVVVPVHDMENGQYFLDRLLDSLEAQTFRNFELVVTKQGKMAENTNAGIKEARGKIVKILFMDDYLLSPDALQHIHDNFRGGWLATGCMHDSSMSLHERFLSDPHYPRYSSEVPIGKNTIGSPSVVAFENNNALLFDENMSWLLDCELYGRLYDRYGEPTILNELDVAIGVGPHQTTHKMSNEEKWKEHEYLMQL